MDVRPDDATIEQRVLGLFLVRPHLVKTFFCEGRPDDFADAYHAELAGLVLDFDREGRAVTPITLSGWAKHLPGYQETGGLAYLSSLAWAAPAMPSAASEQAAVMRELALQVVDARMRRDAAAAAAELQAGLTLGLGMRESMAAVIEVAQEAEARREHLAQAVRQISAAGAGLDGDASGVLGDPIPTGLDGLDRILGGLYPGNLIVAAGRPGMGKSSLGTNFARAAATANFGVDFFSLEMTGAELAARLAADLDYDRYDRADERPLWYSRLIQHRASGRERERAGQMLQLMSALDIVVHERSNQSITEIGLQAGAQAALSRGRKRLVIIDHLHIVRPSDRYKNRYGEVTEITHASKALAKRLGQPVLLLAQLSRGVERREEEARRPALGDLRDSGSIEEDADVVLLVHRPAYYVERKRPAAGRDDPGYLDWHAKFSAVEHVLDIDVAKNRNGPTDTVRLWVDIASSAIRDREPEGAGFAESPMRMEF